MTDIRNLLDIAAEYVLTKKSIEENSAMVSETEADATLSQIASRFEYALNVHLSNA